MAAETSAERAAAVSRVLQATAGEPESVKQAAVDALVAAKNGGMTETATGITAVLSNPEVANAPAPVKAAAVTAVGSDQGRMPPPPADKVTGLWWALVIGLLVLLLVTLAGLLWTILDGDQDTNADKVLIVFTPLLTGLLGLFAPSPRQATPAETSTG